LRLKWGVGFLSRNAQNHGPSHDMNKKESLLVDMPFF